MNKSKKIALEIKKVSKEFILPHQKVDSIKSVFVNPFRSYTKERQKALSSVSLEIEEGEFFGIVGRNGSGKSTLLKCIAGVYKPDTGTIKVNGTLVPFIELGVGFNSDLSGRDNVYLNGAMLGFSREEMTAMYDEIVEFAELEEFMDQKLKNYSSGMQVRLAFSIAIRAKADVLLLDEVLAVGDTAFKRKCNRYFENIKNSNTTVILVTHDMASVQKYCDRATLLHKGEQIMTGTAQEVADEYNRRNIAVNDTGAPKLEEKNDSVQVKITKQDKKSVTFTMNHEEKTSEELYFGFSLIKDGATFAEAISIEEPKGGIRYKRLECTVDISQFNPGIYEISATLFSKKNREPIAFVRSRPQFLIEGSSSTFGGALKLNITWK